MQPCLLILFSQSQTVTGYASQLMFYCSN